MSDYDDYYGNTSRFDEEVESFKAALRAAVKQETQEELEALRTTSREMTAKLANLDKLEREAEAAKWDYGHKLNQAEAEARRTVQKEGLRKLLELLREPRYRVERSWDLGPKCGKCDEERRLAYTTPLGRESYESCDCATRSALWTVEETLVHEVSRRSGKIIAWYHGTSRYFDDDSLGSPTVLNSPDGVPLEEMVKNPRDYGFDTEAAAMVLAEALNDA